MDSILSEEETIVSEPARTCPQCNASIPDGSASSLCAKCLLQVGFETNPGPASDSESRAYQPTFIAPTIDELAPHFPQLEILEQIGQGGMGVVYRARQTELDRIVALKILRTNISADVRFAERFQREARALAKLNHPNIITIYDFGRKDGLFFFIMEYVDGTNLRHVERTGQLSPQEALCIVPQVCSALQYAHDHGVVHRDIKPENILITKSGDVRIADFGLAKLAGIKDEAPLTGTWQVMGTPHYMAPEQFERPTTVDHRADIYSLGVVIYELLTGELPLGRFLLPSEKARIDVRLDEVVLKSLAKEPERRYQRVTDVATAVNDASCAPPIEETRYASVVLGRTKHSLETGWANAQKNLIVLHNYRHALGTSLMWVSALDVMISCLLLMDHPSYDAWEFMCSTAVAAGCIAFWFGRRYSRNAASPLLLSAAMMSIPWLSPLMIFSFARMTLTLLILFILYAVSRNKVSNPVNSYGCESPPPDLFDKAITALRSARSAVTLRILVLTILGIGGWCLAWGLPTVGIVLLFYDSGPTNHSPRHADLSIGDLAAIGSAVTVWLIGFVRVLRVLYRHLWKSATATRLNDPSAMLSARREWNRCSSGLAVSAAATGVLAMIAVWSGTMSTLSLPANAIENVPPRLSWSGLLFPASSLLSSSIVAGALLARPVFRNAGRSVGLFAGVFAMLTPLVSVVTFPNGLAAWILLTELRVRQLFGDTR